jgi:general secretion pathway protein D
MRLILISLLLVLYSSLLSADCENKVFSFTIKDSGGQSISIMDVLENISDECKITLVFEDNSVKERLNKKLDYINVTDFSLKDILDLVLTYNNIFYKLTNNKEILKLANFKTKTYFIDYVSFSQTKSTSNKVIKTGSSGEGDGSTTMDFASEFKFWGKISEEIDFILYRDEDAYEIRAKALINQEAGMLTVTGTTKQLKRVEKYIASLMKRLHKQILLEAKIIEVTTSSAKTQGIDWSKFQLSLSGSSDALNSRITDGTVVNTLRKPNYLIGYDFSMDGLMKFLKTQGDVNIVSNPKVMTLNNQSAIINVGTEINYRYDTGSTTTTTTAGATTTPSYQVASTFVGVTLDITPQVTENDYIILKINPVISEVKKEHLDANGVPFLAPDITVKQLSSIVKIKDKNKVLIGGLISKDVSFNNTSVPLLSSIPLLGSAFKSTSKEVTKSELVIVIIPHIVDGMHNPNLDEVDEKYTTKEF